MQKSRCALFRLPCAATLKLVLVDVLFQGRVGVSSTLWSNGLSSRANINDHDHDQDVLTSGGCRHDDIMTNIISHGAAANSRVRQRLNASTVMVAIEMSLIYWRSLYLVEKQIKCTKYVLVNPSKPKCGKCFCDSFQTTSYLISS